VDGLFALPGVRSVRVLPSAAPPHKPTIASAQDRVEMVRLAFAPSAASPHRGPVEIDLCEIERSAALSGALTYSFDTLNELRQLGTPLAFVLGTDQFLKLPSWHRFPDVLGLCHWIVLERQGEKPGAWQVLLAQWEAGGLVRAEAQGWRIQSGGQTFIQSFATQAPALSSTQIRESLARHGNPPAGSIQPEVIAYLMKRRLYGTGSS
jgi:nicotinate-nucleotide adenylyltransferase